MKMWNVYDDNYKEDDNDDRQHILITLTFALRELIKALTSS